MVVTPRHVGAIVAYLAVVLVPLLVAVVPPRPAGRGAAVEVGVAVGFIAFAMLGAQFLLTARFPRLAAPFGLDWLLKVHRVAGVLAALAVLSHVGILVAIDPAFRAFLDPFDDLARAGALWLLLGATSGLVVLTVWRRQLGIAYQWWRLLHGLLALLVMMIAVVHVFQVGHYSAVGWKMVFWGSYGAGAAGLLIWTRGIRPIRSLQRPWSVVEVREEGPQVWTLTIEPDGHDGLPLRAGQFAWLALDQPPWHIDVHPYSFSSSEEEAERTGRVSFTIKELGDFTSRVGEVPLGTRAYLDGPYGNFVLASDATAAVFVVGGIGMTPALSILRTMRDRGDERPTWLIYGAPRPGEIIARDELVEMSERGALHLTFVVEEADHTWPGERGVITRDLLRRSLLDLSDTGVEVFCCGPDQMMDAVLPALRQLGADPRRIRAERFDLA
jgi:predicted ferric reductase